MVTFLPSYTDQNRLHQVSRNRKYLSSHLINVFPRLRDRHWKRLRQQHWDGRFSTHGEHRGKRELANIEEILNGKNITGPFKIAQKIKEDTGTDKPSYVG